MIYSQSLQKEFTTKQELFRTLKANEQNLIMIKKSQVYKSANKGQYSPIFSKIETNSIKEYSFVEDGYIYPVINTTRFLDYHDDVHFDSLWNKTLKEQQGKINYVNSHKLDILNVIAWAKDVQAFTYLIDWANVGKNYVGKTEALIFKIAKDKIRLDAAKEVFDNKIPMQGSVSMIYVKIKLGMKTDDKDMIENREYYESKAHLIVNQDRLKEQEYFFGVEEARIYQEGSMVFAGSNDATEIYYPENKKIEPSNDTQKTIDTQIVEPSRSLKNYLLNN